jgi:hypothetical protein
MLFAALLISACSSSEDLHLTERGLPGEISDPSEYSRIMQEAGDVPALAHFPTAIPKDAELVRFHFHPSVFQGGTALQLRVRLPGSEVEAIRLEFIDKAKYIYSAQMENDGISQDEEVRTTGFYTGDDSSSEFPDAFEILVLNAEYLGSDDAPWNHGVSYGIAVSIADSEIVYWYEDW